MMLCCRDAAATLDVLRRFRHFAAMAARCVAITLRFDVVDAIDAIIAMLMADIRFRL